MMQEFEAYDLGDGEFCLSVSSRKLFRGRVKTTLAGQALDLLIYLVQNSGNAIKNGDLEQCIWGDAGDRDKLKTTFTKIYSALGDVGNKIGKYIERDGEFTQFIGKVRRIERSGHGVTYLHSHEYGARVRELLASSRRKHRFYIAMGELRFFSAWLLRDKELARAKVSTLVLLGLNPSRAVGLEREKKLRPGYGATMVDNVREVSRLGLPVEHRVWPRLGEFHGFVYDSVAVTGRWGIDEAGYYNVETEITEVHREQDKANFAGILNAFKTAKLINASVKRPTRTTSK